MIYLLKFLNDYFCYTLTTQLYATKNVYVNNLWAVYFTFYEIAPSGENIIAILMREKGWCIKETFQVLSICLHHSTAEWRSNRSEIQYRSH